MSCWGPCVGQGVIIKRNSMAVEPSVVLGLERVIESAEAPVDGGDTSSINLQPSLVPSDVFGCVSCVCVESCDPNEAVYHCSTLLLSLTIKRYLLWLFRNYHGILEMHFGYGTIIIFLEVLWSTMLTKLSP